MLYPGGPHGGLILFMACVYLQWIFFTDRIRRKVVIEKERAKTKDRELAQAKEIEKAYKQLEITHETLKATQFQSLSAFAKDHGAYS